MNERIKRRVEALERQEPEPDSLPDVIELAAGPDGEAVEIWRRDNAKDEAEDAGSRRALADLQAVSS